MKIGIIGVNNLTLDLASKAAKSGYEVLINHTRDNNVIKETVKRMGNNVKLVTKHEAVSADIMVLFIPRENLEAWTADLPDMTDKIILHLNNPLFNQQSFPSSLEIKSATDIVADLLPASHVIKIFSALEPVLTLAERKNQDRNEICYDGIDQYAKNVTKAFLESLQFLACDFNCSCSVSTLKVSA